jgi:hypothetical protein
MIDGEHFFIRCILHLPIIGSTDQRFGYGVWSSLSRENFVRYAETFNSGAQGGLRSWFGYLSNRLHGYPDTFLLKCMVQPQDGRMRPALEQEPSAHPLSLEQRDGITLDRVLELYAVSGHDVHAALDI